MHVDYPELVAGYAGDPATARRIFRDVALFRIREHQWFQLQDGQLDEDTFRSYLQVLVSSLEEDESAREAWDGYVADGGLNSRFAEMVADELSRE